ncbi:insulinase family protein, partial [Aliarcobacter lanthieri]
MEIKDPGIFMFLAVANENIVALKIEKEILDIIAKIQKGEVSQTDLDKISITTKADCISSLGCPREGASLYGTCLGRDNIK